MSYARLIDLNLTRAFNRLKDLAKLATVVKRENAAFDFGSKNVTATTATLTFKAIIVESSKKSKERNSMETQIMFKKADVGDLTMFDTVTISGMTYKVGTAIKTDGYISLVNIHREG